MAQVISEGPAVKSEVPQETLPASESQIAASLGGSSAKATPVTSPAPSSPSGFSTKSNPKDSKALCLKE